MSVVFLNHGEPTGRSWPFSKYTLDWQQVPFMLRSSYPAIVISNSTSVTAEILEGVAARSNVKIPEADVEHYRHLLDSFDATAQQVANLPSYTNPELLPAKDTLPRSYLKQPTEKNPLNAWSHKTNIKSSAPKSHVLEGKTVSVKDNISLGWVPITAGTFPALLNGEEDYPISEIDAVIVARILEAGGTIVGTATCEHFSMSPMSYTSASGAVHNPWKKGWTAGGSSSGPGVLVGVSQICDWRRRHGLPDLPADELGEGTDMAIGGDQGGSIRIPAAYCGIYGLKPTHGLVPYTGILSLNPMIDHTGPMAKSVEDTATLLEVIAGYDGFDPRMTPESPKKSEVKDYLGILNSWIKEKQNLGEWTPSSAGKGLRIGVIKESFEVLGLTDEVRALVNGAIDRFKAIGSDVKEVSIPIHIIGPSIWTIATRIGIATVGFQNHPFHLLNYPLPGISPPPLNQTSYAILTKHNPAAVNVIFNSTFLQHNRAPSLQAKAMMHVHELRAAYDAALKDFDVLVTPVNPKVGIPHPELQWNVGEKMAPSVGGTLNTCQFNITGHPGFVMPIGFGDAPGGAGGKLPVAMQLVAKRWDDEMCFKVAKAWEVPGLGLDSWDGR